jgi:glycosyltransferase involved in cell wall biosynthesis
MALQSVYSQEYGVDEICVAIDKNKDGAWKTRQRATDMANTDWIAYLDDDDMLYPQHIRLLMECALARDADYVFSYFDLTRTPDILGYFGKQFDNNNPHHTTMTVLVRTKLAQSVQFTPRLPEHIAGGEDWRFLLSCVNKGAKIVHLPEQTWWWRMHDSHTSGREDRW